jgi:hypothetical protein
MNWNKPSDKKPDQGKKILCMLKVDFYVAQRFGPYWFPIPFYDSLFSRHSEPELWQDIYFPAVYSGKMRVQVNGRMYDIDELEEHHPDIHKTLVDGQLKLFEDMKNGRKMDIVQSSDIRGKKKDKGSNRS